MEVVDHPQVKPAKAALKLAKAIGMANHVYLCGNGGSAANAIHIANDLVSCGVRAHALTADVATLTAIANDYSYAEIFSRQVDAFGCEGDLLIALSGSGASQNIWEAIQSATHREMVTWAIFGDFCHEIPTDFAPDFTVRYGKTMQKAEEYQLTLGHEVMSWLRSAKEYERG